MNKLLFIAMILFSIAITAQESKAYLAFNVGASIPGGEIAAEDQANLKTGLDVNLDFGYRFNEQWGAFLTYGMSANEIDFTEEDFDEPGTTVWRTGYIGIGPIYAIGLGENWSWDIRPGYVLAMPTTIDYEGGDLDVDAKGSGWMFGNSFVMGLSQGFKLAINIDYLSGTYSEYGDGDNASEPDKSSDGLTRLAIGVGARYNF